MATRLTRLEAARAAHRLADLPHLEPEDGVGEHGREFGGLSPAEVAAFERLLSVGMGHRYVREVRSSPDFLEHALGADTPLLDLLGGCAVGNRNQDVSNPELMPVRLRAPALHHGKIVVDVALRDVDLVLDPAPAHLRNHDVVPDLLSKLRVFVAVAFEGVAELAQRELVLLRDPEHGLVEPVVVDANARIACELQLETGEDQSLEHPPAQCIGRRRSRAGLAKLLAHPLQPGFQLARRDDVVVDDGGDAVEPAAGCGLGRDARGAQPGDGACDDARAPMSSEGREARHQNSFS